PMTRPLQSLLPVLALSLLSGTPGHATPVDAIAEQYVRLVLAMGEHDKGYVDAYYGPAEWRQQVAEAPPSPEAIASSARQLRDQLPPAADIQAASALERLRNNYLSTQLGALAAYAGPYGKDTPRDFDAEARAPYAT